MRPHAAGVKTRARILTNMNRLLKEFPAGVTVAQLADALDMSGMGILYNLRLLARWGQVRPAGKWTVAKEVLWVPVPLSSAPAVQPEEVNPCPAS